MKTTLASRILFTLLLGAGLGNAARAALAPAQADAFVHDFYAAYNAAGAASLADFYTADATFTDPTFGLDLKGRGQIGKLLVAVLAKYQSLEFEISHTLRAGDELVVEGTMVGQLKAGTVRVRFVSVFHFTDGKISGQRDLFDVLHFYEQLGIVPPAFRGA